MKRVNMSKGLSSSAKRIQKELAGTWLGCSPAMQASVSWLALVVGKRRHGSQSARSSPLPGCRDLPGPAMQLLGGAKG